MITAAIVATWLAQAPIGMSSHAPPVTSPPREWDLAGKFTLRQENFLRWQAVVDPSHPYKGLHSEPRPTWTLELTPTRPMFKNFSLMVESLPALASGGHGYVASRVRFRIPGTQIHIGLGVRMRASYSSAR